MNNIFIWIFSPLIKGGDCLEFKKVLEVNNLNMTYHTLDGETEALKDISFDVHEGEIAAIVGPSGCGKSTTQDNFLVRWDKELLLLEL